MRTTLFITLITCIISVAGCTGGSDSRAVPLIFDTDMGPDYDDVGALTLLHALADSGEVRLLATVSSNMNEFAVPCIDVINTYYGRPDLPVGRPLKGPDIADFHQEKWMEALPARFPHKINKTGDAPDAVKVYRSILAKEKDASVVIVTVGFLTNLAALLESQPDEYSTLNGKELVREKVKLLVSMAAAVPSGSEYNVNVDAPASQKVFNEWPTRFIISSFEIGLQIRTGKRLINSSIAETPAKTTFSIMLKQENPEGRMSWDQTAALVGVRGVKKYFDVVKGRVTVASDGSNTWQDEPEGPHERLTWKMPIEELTSLIEGLMMHEKKK